MLRFVAVTTAMVVLALVPAAQAEGGHLADRYTALHRAAVKKDLDPGRNIRQHGIRYRWVSSNHKGRHWNERPATYKDYAKAIHGLRTLLVPPDMTISAIPGYLYRIAFCETGGTMNPGIVSSTGKFRGLFQFDYRTWATVGGKGDPAAATVREQVKRATILYAKSGAAPWPVCGR